MKTAIDQRFTFYADQNVDGVLTISDVWLWFKWVFFLPGDFILAALTGSTIGNFFELSQDSLMGWGSGVFSFFVWLLVLGAITTVIDDVKNGIS